MEFSIVVFIVRYGTDFFKEVFFKVSLQGVRMHPHPEEVPLRSSSQRRQVSA